MKYEIVAGEGSDVIKKFFWLNSETGALIARQPLAGATLARYSVRILGLIQYLSKGGGGREAVFCQSKGRG